MSQNIINLQLQLNSTLAGNFIFHKESAIALRFKFVIYMPTEIHHIKKMTPAEIE